MLDTEAAETLMSLSAPDERKFTSPLYREEGMPWHTTGKKRSFNSFNYSPTNGMASSLPNGSSSLQAYSTLQRKIHERPLTSMIPFKQSIEDGEDDEENVDDDDESDVDMMHGDSDEQEDRPVWGSFRSPFDGLVAAAASNQDDRHEYTSSSTRPISIPGGRNSYADHSPPLSSRRIDYNKSHKWSLSRVKEDASYIGRDCSPTGVEEDPAWFDSYRDTDEYKQRSRLASICSSEGGMSDYGGLGRKHLEEFIRMEISATNENEMTGNQLDVGSPVDGDTKYIGSYSPEARRKRIERFLEKRKKRVWSKKVDYDVRKNFANSRLRVKGRFVKKEDEELLCQLLSYT